MARISDNPSYTELLNQVKGMKILLNLLPVGNTEWRHKLSDIERQIDEIRFTPEKFNQYYSELGWIAYESM